MQMRLLLVFLLVSTAASSAFGQRHLAMPSKGRGILKGAWDVGLDNILLVSYARVSQTGGAGSTLGASYVGGVTPRYFVIDNLSLGLSLNGFLQYSKQSSETNQGSTSSKYWDAGFLGFVVVDYFVRIGDTRMGFRPGVGVGGFGGARSRPDPTREGTYLDSTVYGGAARLGLTFVYYGGPRFNVRGGLDVMARFGKETGKYQGDTESFASVDAGFTIGIGGTL